MKLIISSFDKLQRRARQPFFQGTTIISIGDPEMDPPVLIYQPDHYLRLAFDDITLEGLRIALDIPPMDENDLEKLLTEQYKTYPFTKDMARQTAEFVQKHLAETSILICQCQFGQSRSAGIAAAIAEHLSGQGQRIFEDSRYSPNHLVYTRLLEAFRNYR